MSEIDAVEEPWNSADGARLAAFPALENVTEETADAGDGAKKRTIEACPHGVSSRGVSQRLIKIEGPAPISSVLSNSCSYLSRSLANRA